MTLLADAQKFAEDAQKVATAAVTWASQLAANTPSSWAEAASLLDYATLVTDYGALESDLKPPPPPLVVAETGSLVATVGVATTLATISAAGGTPGYAYSEDASAPLPAGLTLNGNVLSGTPTAAGTFTVKVDVVDSGTPTQLKNSVSFSITVNPAPVTPPPVSGKPLTFGIYGNSGSASAAQRVAKELNVTAQAVSLYCTGDSWPDIVGSTWAKGECGSLKMLLAVNLVPDGQNLTGITPAIASSYGALAKIFTPGDVARPAWEWDGNWFRWCIGKGGSAPVPPNTSALLVSGFRAVALAMKAANPNIKIDWSANAGSSTLAQLEASYPGDDVVDYIGFDHYDPGTQAATIAAVTPAITMCNLHNKPLSCGEFGAATNGADNPAFVDLMGMMFCNPALFSQTFGLPTYTVGPVALFTDSTNNIENKPKMLAEFPKAFAGV